jgi:hypothetical protein
MIESRSQEPEYRMVSSKRFRLELFTTHRLLFTGCFVMCFAHEQ